MYEALKNVEAREYPSRIARLKPEILKQENLVDRIKRLFHYKYNDGPAVNGSRSIGAGSNHVVYGIGAVKDPKNERDFFLALRLLRSYPIVTSLKPNPEHLSELFDEIRAYEGAFLAERNPPYFAGIIRVSFDNKNLQYCGIITEDISCGGSFLIEERGREDVVRIKPDGAEERFYLDPTSFGSFPSVDTTIYMQKKYRIDV